jgi:hypothetical protein
LRPVGHEQARQGRRGALPSPLCPSGPQFLCGDEEWHVPRLRWGRIGFIPCRLVAFVGIVAGHFPSAPHDRISDPMMGCWCVTAIVLRGRGFRRESHLCSSSAMLGGPKEWQGPVVHHSPRVGLPVFECSRNLKPPVRARRFFPCEFSRARLRLCCSFAGDGLGDKAGLSTLNEGAKVSCDEKENRGKTSAENLRVR